MLRQPHLMMLTPVDVTQGVGVGKVDGVQGEGDGAGDTDTITIFDPTKDSNWKESHTFSWQG
ncbi:MAG: hypothetical protein P7H58_15800 [Microcoleus anatoxicus]